MQDVLKKFKGKRILLLQSQFSFFYRFVKDLKTVAKEVHKINFNGGDWIFYPKGAVNFTGTPDQIESFLKDYVKKHKIDTVIMFNDCKPIHRLAKKTLSDSVEFYVFEQGYIRPDYITMEKGGVNGYSKINKDPNFYKSLPDIKIEKPIPVGSIGLQRFLLSVIYFVFFMLLKPVFKSSDYSVPGFLKYSCALLKGVLFEKYYRITQKRKAEKFAVFNSGRYYFVPLQVSLDSQIRFHSDYNNIFQFIKEVILSFSKNAPQNTYLVFKQHPFDLGFHDYTDFIEKFSSVTGIKDRVKYFKSGDIDTFIKYSIGCIMVNSTCGVTTLKYKKPLKVMGRAIYDIDGIVYKKNLDTFWQDALIFRPDSQLIDKFLVYLIQKTQINGSFYKKVTKNTCSGLNFKPVEKIKQVCIFETQIQNIRKESEYA